MDSVTLLEQNFRYQTFDSSFGFVSVSLMANSFLQVNSTCD